MWKFILKGLLTASSNPAVRQWAQRKARKIIEAAALKANKQVAELSAAVGIDPGPKPKVATMIRTEKDILRPGQVAVVDGKAFRIIRLLSSNAKETVYEGVEA